MAQECGTYVSVFKIDGKPILPPVIDDNRRIELNRDRMLAMEVDRRLQLKRTECVDHCPTDDEHVIASDGDETLVKDAVECSISNYDTSAAVESLLDDNVSTFKQGEKQSGSEINEEAEAKTDRDYENMLTPEKPQDVEVDTKTKQLEIPQLSLNIGSNISYDVENLSPSFSLHSSPSLGALDESCNQSLYFTPMSGRESFSPRPRQEGHLPSPRLIRSNSYTLEKPSPLLLKHMEINGIRIGSSDSPMKSPMSLNEFRKNQNVTPSNIPRKSLGGNMKQLKTTNNLQIPSNRMSLGPNIKLSSVSSNNSLNSNKSSANKQTKVQNGVQNRKLPNNQSNGLKTKESVLRSIYGSVKPSKVQHSAKKVNGSTTSLASSKSGHIQPPSVESISQNVSNGNINSRNIGEILAIIEKQHSDQMNMLLKRQQEEQKRMQEEFLHQQEELLKMISNLVTKKGGKQSTPNEGEVITHSNSTSANKSNGKMLIEEVNSEVSATYDTNGNRVNRFTPPENSKCIRRLMYDDNKLVPSEIDIDKSSLSSLSLSTVASEHCDTYTIEEVQAATTIQAYVRGYLTRRLMKTARVKEIKKAHYDTLLLLLDICEEKNENESKSDVEFKFHLLQQLAKLCVDLKEIFIKMPMAERMNIIAKDREWQQFKLNRSKSSEGNKSLSNHMIINGNSHLAKPQSARFEKKF